MEIDRKIIDWFEIPVRDLDSSMDYYSKIFNVQLFKGTIKGLEVAFFSPPTKEVNGALVQIIDEGMYCTSKCGSIVYLNGGIDLIDVLNKVEVNGGQIIVSKTLISPEIGFYALFSDPDGNTIGLHSMK
jgi:predicted enzyme related to lactoylglutathione lyase